MGLIDRISTAALLACAGLALTAPGAASAAAPVSRAQWGVDYGAFRCQLIRHFGDASQAYRLAISRDWTFGGYQWALYGAALPLHPSMKSVEIALGPSEGARRFKFDSYAVTEGERRFAWHDSDGLLFKGLREGDAVRITSVKNLDVSLELTNLAAAVEALETCENDMFAGWGFDAKMIRTLSRQAEPANYAGRWVTNDDYPHLDFAQKNEGTTTFLLTVDAGGKATHCRIVDTSGFSTLDKQTCGLVLTRAAFHPARDAEGQAVASFYINRVRWQVPR